MRGAPPPAREVAHRLSPVWHSGRNAKSDRMRQPPSLAGSERGEEIGSIAEAEQCDVVAAIGEVAGDDQIVG